MSKAPTAAQRSAWSYIVELGCIVQGCDNPPAIHHCHTGAGGRKNHDKVIPLCHYHHQGERGIHTLGRRVWARHYGTEEQLMRRVDELLGMP